ncbi:MAG: ABC transporter permease [Polyangiaceae bacterium]
MTRTTKGADHGTNVGLRLARAIGRRFAFAFAVVFAVTTLTFVVNNVLPTDPARMVAGAQARPADVARIRTQLGLDRPLPERYVAFLRRLVHGATSTHASAKDHANCATLGPVHVDLDRSYQRRRPVATILGERLPRSLVLATAAIVVQLVVGAGLGILAASRARRPADTGLVLGSTLLVSVPTFVLGVALQYLLAVRLRLVPTDGFGRTEGDHAVAVILPALTLGIFGAAFYVRFVREEVLAEIRHDYVRTARAKGAGAFAVLFRHAFRNTAVPLVTSLGMDFGTLVAGAVVTETLFRYPGIGELMSRAVLDRDGPVLMGTVLVASIAVVVASMLVDAIVLVLDPRLRSR